jgi:hypothetical protein
LEQSPACDYLLSCENKGVKHRAKEAKLRKAGDQVARIMHAALLKLPKQDQGAAIKAVLNTKITTTS